MKIDTSSVLADMYHPNSKFFWVFVQSLFFFSYFHILNWEQYKLNLNFSSAQSSNNHKTTNNRITFQIEI